MKWQLWLPTIVLISGCAESRYVQEGKGVIDREHDTTLCEDMVLAEHQGLRETSAAQRQEFMDDCMKEKGYRVKQR